MKTYDEKTLEEIESPDLSKGMTYPGKIKTGVEYVVMSGSQEKYPPNGLRKEKAVYEECLFYHKYADGENPGTNPAPSGGVATWDELAAAYNEEVGMA